MKIQKPSTLEDLERAVEGYFNVEAGGKGKGSDSSKVTVLENTECAFRSVIAAAIIRFKHQVI